MLPSIGDESDYGSLAQKMLDDLFSPSVDTDPSDVFADESTIDPPSPSPGGDVAGSQLLKSGSGDVGLESPLSLPGQIEGDKEDSDGT